MSTAFNALECLRAYMLSLLADDRAMTGNGSRRSGHGRRLLSESEIIAIVMISSKVCHIVCHRQTIMFVVYIYFFEWMDDTTTVPGRKNNKHK